jgi:glycosyltransferase involved in cell wall biosynthesis
MAGTASSERSSVRFERAMVERPFKIDSGGSGVSFPRIAVVIPAYRAEAHVTKVLAKIPPFVQLIIVVDDRSPDATAELVERCPDPRVRLVRHAENTGVGGAVLTGYGTAIAAGAEIIVKMDSDDQMNPDFLLPLIAPILSRQADYTKGNRFLHMRELTSMPLLRRVGNAGLSFLTKLASGYWNIFDPTNGYTAISARVARLIRPDAVSMRYFFESSMLLELSLLRGVVRDVPVPAVYGEEVSSLSERDALLGFPPRLIRGLIRRILIQYFLRDFSAFSIFLLAGTSFTAFGFLWGAYHWYLSYRLGMVASTGTVMIAVLPIVLGIQFMLQCGVWDIQNIPTQPLIDELEYLQANEAQLGTTGEPVLDQAFALKPPRPSID